MYFRDVLKISILNIIRRRTRSVLTALSIVIGIMSVFLVSTLVENVEQIIISEIEKMGLQGITLYQNREATSLPLTEDDSEKLLSRFPSITHVLPIVLSIGEYTFKGKTEDALLLGVGPHADEVYNVTLLHGRIPDITDVKNTEYISVIDDELANKTYKRTNVVGKKLTITVDNKSIETTIIGVITSQKSGVNQIVGGEIPDFIYVPYTVLNELRNSANIDQFAIKSTAENSTKCKEYAEYLSKIKGMPNSYLATDISEKINNVKKITNIIKLLLTGIASVALIVAGMGIMNTMFSSTIERKREIGISMAIGANAKNILLCFIFEAVIISFIGGIIGSIIGTLIIYCISTNIISFVFSFDLINFLLGILISVFFGIVSSIIPALKASALNPIDALKN